MRVPRGIVSLANIPKPLLLVSLTSIRWRASDCILVLGVIDLSLVISDSSSKKMVKKWSRNDRGYPAGRLTVGHRYHDPQFNIELGLRYTDSRLEAILIV